MSQEVDFYPANRYLMKAILVSEFAQLIASILFYDCFSIRIIFKKATTEITYRIKAGKNIESTIPHGGGVF
ncbi:MAG: hypothetical protein DCF22_18025 [Leptolyngbya sp.]|nr:MAG: hypothetical protein DCF22_18025 [Leptolyngbya sp.]